QMWRCGSNHSRYGPLFCHDLHSLSQHHLAPPASQSLKSNHSIACDLCHHKANFIHMSCDHDTRPVAYLFTKDTAQVIRYKMICVFPELLTHIVPYSPLISRCCL